MRRLLPLALAVALAGCGKDEMPAANVAQSHASTPITMPDPAPSQVSENIPQKVPRGTDGSAPANSAEDSADVRRPAENGYRAIGTEPFWAVTVKGYIDRVEVVHNGQVVARHARSYGHDQQVLDPLHYLAALDRRPAALDHAPVLRDGRLPRRRHRTERTDEEQEQGGVLVQTDQRKQ